MCEKARTQSHAASVTYVSGQFAVHIAHLGTLGQHLATCEGKQWNLYSWIAVAPLQHNSSLLKLAQNSTDFHAHLHLGTKGCTSYTQATRRGVLELSMLSGAEHACKMVVKVNPREPRE